MYRNVVHDQHKPQAFTTKAVGCDTVEVVDWGLAKRLGVPGEAQAPEGNGLPYAPVDGRDGGTATGDVLGTPAFMSPEQAAGRHDAVGPVSDVYGLGATLYALLTGRPPFDADGIGALLHKVEHGDFPPPRKLRPEVPRALEAICLKAMARAPAARYATALELAADLERWLGDEPVRAFREPLSARARRWVRRHRILVTSLAAVLVTSVLLGGGTVGWLAARQAETVRAACGDLDEATRLQHEEKWADARAAVQRAEGRLSAGGAEDLRGRVAQAHADLTMVARLDSVREKRAEITRQAMDLDRAAAVEEYANAFRDYGLDVEGEVAAVAQRVRQSAVKDQLLAALDDWAEYTPDARLRAHLLAVARQADPDPWRDRFRDPQLLGDSLALQRLAADAPLEDLSPIMLEALMARLVRRNLDDFGLLQRAQTLHPGDYFLNELLAESLDRRADQLRATDADLAREQGIGYLRATLAARPGLSLAWTNLGVMLFKQGRLEESEAAHRKALTLQPDNRRAWMQLSAPLRGLGKLDEAERAARTAITLSPQHAPAWSMLANTLLLQGRLSETEAACHTAMALQPNYPFPYFHLAKVRRRQGQNAEAEALEHEVACLRQGIVEDSPIRPGQQIVRLEDKVADWLQGKAKPADALELTVLTYLAAHRRDSFDAAAQLCARSFADQPDFAEATVDFPTDRPRYLAACCAAQASLGRGDASALKAELRGLRRQQALAWLRQELAYWDKQLAENRPAARERASRALGFWQVDGWLAGVPNPRAQADLSPAERAACSKLWDEVADLLKRARAGFDEANNGGSGR